MAWRLHLTDSPIRRLDILSGRPSLLAAWSGALRVALLDLQNGAKREDRTIEPIDTDDRQGEPWQTFITSLIAPNHKYLSEVRTPKATIYTTAEGDLRLYRTPNGDLLLDNVDGERTLSTQIDGVQPRWVALGMDRANGLIAALDADARLHLFKQNERIGVVATELQISDEFRPILLVSKGNSAIFLSDGAQIAVFDPNGKCKRRVHLHYQLGAMSCSSDGRRFAATDLDSNVIRLYNGSDLQPTHQRHAADLLAESKRAQLLAGDLPTSAALGPVAINSRGVVAFALVGTICVTNLAKMTAMPSARSSA